MDHREHDEVLRDIVRSVEQNSDMDPDHPDLLALKRILLEKISPAEAGDGVPETIATACPPTAVPVDVSVSQALGLSATGDAPPLPTDPAVREVLGLGTTVDQPSSAIETVDDQQLDPNAAVDPSAPPIEGA